MSKQVKPEPVVVTTICSMCSLPWEQHGADPTTEDCIRLLKLELAKRPAVVTYPVYPQPLRPLIGPYTPYWSSVGQSLPVSNLPTITCQTAVKTPRLAETAGVSA
jgi:hypothetical protein